MFSLCWESGNNRNILPAICKHCSPVFLQIARGHGDFLKFSKSPSLLLPIQMDLKFDFKDNLHLLGTIYFPNPLSQAIKSESLKTSSESIILKINFLGHSFVPSWIVLWGFMVQSVLISVNKKYFSQLNN